MKKFSMLFAVLLLVSGIASQVLAAAPFVPVYTTNNNFTALDPAGNTTGGTNDVLFTWDGTLKTAVAVSGQVANATIFSSCPFNGFTWKAHDVAVYGPGTYTVQANCAAKAPACATGTNPITFTVGVDEIGAHVLLDWGTVATNKNIDVVNVWKMSSVFTPDSLWTGACGSNSASTVWDLMSRDDGTGNNGYPMVDGGLIGSRDNFNMMGAPINRLVDTSNNNFTMIDPAGGLTGGTNDVRFTWDGTRKTAVAVSGQVPNATLTSPCPFSGNNWWAHDVAVYGPGTYTVYTGCTGGNPGCGAGSSYTFTVKPNEIGVHMLFNWGSFSSATTCGLTNCDIDVVDVMRPGVFGDGVDPTLCTPNPMWTGACGSNLDTTVWDWMSYDWDADCLNGAAMVDGPFQGFNANFNVMGVVPPGVATKIGIYLSYGDWYLDKNGNGTWDGTPTDSYVPNFGHGVTGAIPVVLESAGTTTIGIYQNGTWFIDKNGNGAWDSTPTDAQYFFGNGIANTVPVTGDWTGTGTSKIGVYADGVWFLDLNGNNAWDGTPTDAQYFFGAGIANAIPVTGDWTGTGITKVGIYKDGTWYLDLNGNGVWDGTPTDAQYTFGNGIANAVPVTGDWTGTGTTKIGIYADGTWYLDKNGNGSWDGASTDAQYFFGSGVAGAVPVTGKW